MFRYFLLNGWPEREQAPLDKLGGPVTQNVLSIMDEPTTGLRFEGIKKLLTVLHKLVDAGNTLVVEHNLDVIKSADWIIDLGPEAGPPADRLSLKAVLNRWRSLRLHTPGDFWQRRSRQPIFLHEARRTVGSSRPCMSQVDFYDLYA